MKTIDNFPSMTWSQFKNIQSGTRVRNNGGWDQCVAVANLYHVSVLKLPLPWDIASAYQWWTSFALQPNLKNNYTQSRTPKAGAVFVARGGDYDKYDGHIGVVIATHADGTFTTMEQNVSASKRYTYKFKRTRGRGILGFLIPKTKTPAKPAEAQKPSKVTQKGTLTMGTFDKSGGQVIAAGQKWKALNVGDKNVITFKSGRFSGIAVATVNIKGTAGQVVELAIARDAVSDAGTTASNRLRVVSGVIPAGGVLKLQVSAGATLTATGQRLRIKLSNNSKKSVTVTRVQWDTMEAK